MRIGYPPSASLPAIDDLYEYANAPASQINSMGFEEITITAPAGYAYQLLEFSFIVEAPAGAGGGTHYITTYGTVFDIGNLYGSSVFGSELSYSYGFFRTADDEQRPPASHDQQGLLRSLWAIGGHTITFGYSNQTDVATTRQRSYKAVFRIVKIL